LLRAPSAVYETIDRKAPFDPTALPENAKIAGHVYKPANRLIGRGLGRMVPNLPSGNIFDLVTVSASTVDWLLVCVIPGILFIAFFLALRLFGFRSAFSEAHQRVGAYECGSEQTAQSISVGTAVQFFRTMLLFLIFEVEIAVLFTVAPLLSLAGVSAILVITVFILIVQIGTVYEVRAGALKWVKSVLPCTAALSSESFVFFETGFSSLCILCFTAVGFILLYTWLILIVYHRAIYSRFRRGTRGSKHTRGRRRSAAGA